MKFRNFAMAFTAFLPLFFSCLSAPKNSAASFAQSASRPQWITDEGRQAQFPKSAYVSVLAWTSGNAEEAKTKAAAELANYVKSSINAQINTSFDAKQMDSATLSEFQKTRNYQDNTQITSQNTLYQIQYTVPWYDKTNKEYYCCAYINRAEAWSYIEPKMQKVRENFTKQYNNALTQTNNISKINGIRRAQALLPQFYEYYDFAIFIDANKAAAYKELDNLAVASYERLALIKQETKVKINVTNDNSKRAYTKLSSLFEKAGFIVANSSADYVADAEVIYSLDLNGEIYTAYPEFNLNLAYQGKTVSSYNKHLPKVAMYEKDKAIIRIFYNLESELENTFIKECIED